jgi:hypothetical protein
MHIENHHHINKLSKQLFLEFGSQDNRTKCLRRNLNFYQRNDKDK